MSSKSKFAGVYIPVRRLDRIRDLSGQTFGRWCVVKVLGIRPAKSRKEMIFECRCACVKVSEVIGRTLTNGTSTNCGCIGAEKLGELRRTHHKSRTNEFSIWCGIKRRCSNVNYAGYARYGGRGIKVCERWENFENFYSDMGPRPSIAYSVGRKCNDEGYNPQNCRWETKAEQAKNTSRNTYLKAGNKIMCMADWSRETGVHISTICNRLKRGWAPEKAVLTKTKLQCLTHP